MVQKLSPDRIDFGILRMLMSNARASNKEIAAAVGLAPSSCHQRIKALLKQGMLRGTHAEVDLPSLGWPLEALLFVQVAKLEGRQIDQFVYETATVSEVRNVFLVSGHFDLVVHVVARDMEHLKCVISENFSRHASVIRVETSVVFARQTRHEMPAADQSSKAR
jgi:DNA-binding Lrp family transcriptional regulator